MGHADRTSDHSAGRPEGLTTAILVLVAVRMAGRPLTTYEMGLDIIDDHEPPRPISVIVKSLAGDGYLVSAGRIGKRMSRWGLAPRGEASLEKRPDLARKAELWLIENPNSSDDERLVQSIMDRGTASVAGIAAATGLTTSPIRTSMRRIQMRRSLRDDATR